VDTAVRIDDGPVTAFVETVNVVHALRPGFFHETAIDKRPVSGPVVVTTLGLAGDQQISSVHGGPDKAVYAYATEDADWWGDRLEREVPPGLFGENLRTSGLDVSGAQIGQRWQIGQQLLLEVRMPRTPCENLSQRVGIEGFHLEFNASGKVGALLRVIEQGTVQAGAEIVPLDPPGHGVTVADLAKGPTPAQMLALLDSGVPLARSVRSKAQRMAARG
jgi:MOSC domain-containing protein YiiM